MAPGPIWRVRFWSIDGGRALSMIGSAMTQFVLTWWITDTTDDLGALAIAMMPIGLALWIDVVAALVGIMPLLLFTVPQHRTPSIRIEPHPVLGWSL